MKISDMKVNVAGDPADLDELRRILGINNKPTRGISSMTAYDSRFMSTPEIERLIRRAVCNGVKIFIDEPVNLRYDINDMMPRSEAPASPQQDQLVEQLRQLKNEGQDISGVKASIDRIEAEHKEQIIKDLRGVAGLAKRSAKPGKQFVLAYWHNNQAKTVIGIDYGHGQFIAKEDEDKEYRVHLRLTNYVLSQTHHTMQSLAKTLHDKNIPYHIAYLD